MADKEKEKDVKPATASPGSPSETVGAVWTDILWIPILFSMFVGFLIIAGIDLDDYVKTKCYRGHKRHEALELLEFHTLMVLLCSALIAIVLSCLYYIFAFIATKQFISLTMVMQVIGSVAMTVYYLSNANWMAGTFSLMWMFATIVVYLVVRNSITTASEIFQTTLRIAQTRPSVFILAGLSSIFPAGVSLLSGMILVANYAKSQSYECSQKAVKRPVAEFFVCLIYVTMVSYVLVEVFKAIIRSAICSVFGTWYYTPKATGSSIINGLKRASSFSLGTICFGCFLLSCGNVTALGTGALAQLITTKQTDISVIMILWLTTHCVTVVDWILGHFNNYIYAHVALYNYPYVEAARRTVLLFKEDGFKAISNDCLAGGVLTFGASTIGSVTALLVFLYLKYMAPLPVQGIPFIVSYVAIFASQIASVFIIPISSGVQTLFIASFHHPHVLAEMHPEELVDKV